MLVNSCTPPENSRDWECIAPANPGIAVEKSTNGVAADAAPGPFVAVGDTVTWTYAVTNTGDVTLTDVVVTDDILGIEVCRFAQLPVGDTQSCDQTGTATIGQYANLATATGTAGGAGTVQATDPSHYFGLVAEIDIEKATNGVDADLPFGPIITVGSTVTWTYVVTNTGNVELTNVAVVDDPLGAITCPATTLAAGESMTCTASGTAVAGPY